MTYVYMKVCAESFSRKKKMFFLMASFKKGGASSVLAIGVYLVPKTQFQQENMFKKNPSASNVPRHGSLKSQKYSPKKIIQARWFKVTFLSPSVEGHLTLEKVTNHHPKKRSLWILTLTLESQLLFLAPGWFGALVRVVEFAGCQR